MRIHHRQKRRQAGNALIVTIITMAIVGVFIDLAMQYTNSIGRNVRRSLLLRQATNIGDASTEMAFSAWRAICRTNQTKIFATSDFATQIPTPTPGNFPGVSPSEYTLSNYAIYPLDSNWKTKTAGSATPAPIAGTASGDRSYYYLASADVVIPTLVTTSGNLTNPNDPANVVARVRRVFQKQILSLWRYAIFYTDDMEIHPGAPMVVNGDVHTNGNLYTGHDTLTLNGNTTYVDLWSIGFMPGDSTHPETPTSPHWAPGQPPTSGQSQQPYGVVLDDYHVLVDYTTSPTTLDPYRFQTQAGAVITIDAANNVKIYNNAGTDITNATSGTDKTMATAFKNAIPPTNTNQTITDNREGATTGNASIRLASLDVGVITTAINQGDLGNFNGIIYIADISAVLTDPSQPFDAVTNPYDTSKKRGIRLKNGAKLPDGTNIGSAAGLTVVSANPIYVQGDYNTGSTSSVQPPSNSGDPTQPTVAGYTRQPAAVIADAVNILSNSWTDATGGTVPPATNTTVNAAIISGIVPTGSGYYSGGVENFPRFLENWAGKTLTYYGSMLELYNSQQGVGKWGAANVYRPPNRAWYFDTNFISKPPPGVLASFDYFRSRWYME
jgi:type II secretory pathway pseudopilin PulG